MTRINKNLLLLSFSYFFQKQKLTVRGTPHSLFDNSRQTVVNASVLTIFSKGDDAFPPACRDTSRSTQPSKSSRASTKSRAGGRRKRKDRRNGHLHGPSFLKEGALLFFFLPLLENRIDPQKNRCTVQGEATLKRLATARDIKGKLTARRVRSKKWRCTFRVRRRGGSKVVP